MSRIGNLIRDPAELKKRAEQLDKLTSMLDRVTRDDIRGAAQALLDCAHDVQYLLRGELLGCPCRRIEYDEGGSYLVYDDKCGHHRHLKHEEERLKAAYAEVEKKLTNNTRLALIKAALPGLVAHVQMSAREVASKALEVAEATLSALLR